MVNKQIISWGVLLIVCVSAVLFLWGYITSIKVNTRLDYEFVGNMVTAYNGKDTDITIPTSYSINGTETVKQSRIFQTQEEAITYLNSNFTENTDEYNGFKYQLENNPYPWTYVYYQKKNIFVEGNDYQVTSIGSNCFANNKTIRKVEIPNQYVTIGTSAFANCSNLTEIVMPNRLLQINSKAFQNCTRLYNFSLPNTLNTIGTFAFDNCDLITSLTIPANVSSIGYACFRNCANLRTLTLLREVSIVTTSSSILVQWFPTYRLFYNTPMNRINVPNNLLSAYQNTTNNGWKYYTTYFVGV